MIAETAPVTDSTAAPVITDAVPAVEDKKEDGVESPKEEPKKENRRMSRFETFFKGKPKTEKKDEVVAPAAEEPVAASEPVKADETTPAVVEPVSETAPVVQPSVEEPVKEDVKEEEKKEEAAPAKDNRKSSFLTGLKGFTQKVRSPSSEHPPAEPKIEEPSAAPATTEPVTDAPATTAETSEPVVSDSETKEKRRSSFFGFGTVNKKKDVPASEEPVKTDAVEEPVKPVEATDDAAPEVPKKSTEEKVESPASPKEHKESPFASIGRRVSKAIRGDKPKKESKPAAPVEESKDESKVEEPVSEAPVNTLPEPIKQEESSAQPTAIGDVVPEAVTVGSAPKSTPTVSATA